VPPRQFDQSDTEKTSTTARSRGIPSFSPLHR
jgi:hypothetical protein